MALIARETYGRKETQSSQSREGGVAQDAIAHAHLHQLSYLFEAEVMPNVKRERAYKRHGTRWWQKGEKGDPIWP
jgi:hypothetical protein